MQYLFRIFLVFSTIASFGFTNISNPRYVAIRCNPSTDSIKLFNTNTQGIPLRNFTNLIRHTESAGDSILFAMNAGMYNEAGFPVGLYIEHGKVLQKLNTVKKAFGNFYWQPNGVFFIARNGKADIVKTTNFKLRKNIEWATQSGPLLVIDGAIHPEFKQGSNNKHIRNGIGVLPNGEVIMAISKQPVNLYDFALYFKEAGCTQALYLDGAISQVYYPRVVRGSEAGELGPFIAIVTKKRNP